MMDSCDGNDLDIVDRQGTNGRGTVLLVSPLLDHLDGLSVRALEGDQTNECRGKRTGLSSGKGLS
jgi:hypothetical protein